ncbi:MAG: hypothetical protein HC910_00695 [Spirulinaceae cyanobacterium SM2_1_0]|nr:hypothetical protein [Spirulinaceae cyanobacterium SM2_1_0]
MTTANWSQRLEQYTALTPQEALLVDFTVDGEPDRVVIFRGFSSSLMRATAFDPDVPVLPETAMIARIERVVAPYDPAAPQVIATLSVAEMAALLANKGLTAET